MSKKKLSRRKFIVRTLLGGVGVAVGATYLGRNAIRRNILEFVDKGEGTYMGSVDDPMIWFEITNDNIVTLFSPKVEMGQGSLTGLAQIAADELEIDVQHIKVAHASSASGNLDAFATGGSTSISGLWQPLRELSATMREMLKLEAARKLGVEANVLTIKNGSVSDGQQSLTYGEIVQDVSEWEVPDTPTLKPVKDYQFVGKRIPRIDLVDKVIGAPLFGMDTTLPDMLYGAVARSSKIGATYVGVDASAAANMPGVVKIVEEPDFVGVVATSRVAAENAKNALKVTWKTERNWQTADIEEMLQVGKGEPAVIQTEGDADGILSEAEKSEDKNYVTASYNSPLGSHAQMEPNGALADVREDGATIYMATQVIRITRDEVAERLRLEKDQVNIVPSYLGGGFGRRLHTPNAIHAAVLSQAVGKPVKCFLNRKEEFQHDTFRPPTHHVLKAKLNEKGMIEAMEHNVSSGDVAIGSPLLPGFVHSILGSDVGAWRGGMIQYKGIPNFRAVSWRVKLPFATSWWRSLGLLANTFAIESFIDELAIQSGIDPVTFRLNHIQNDKAGNRLKKVIETAVEKANYQDKVVGNRTMGFAASTDASTPVAQVADVSIEGKTIVVHKVTCVIDPGLVVNPDQVKAQCEGCIIMGMSAAMHERMYVEDGQLKPTIYGPYDMALMKHAPKEIDVVILENDDKPGAVGEPPLGPIGAAIANAVFRITGTRLRAMPLKLA